MACRLKLPRGSEASFLRQFVRDGDAVDGSGGILSGLLKYSPDDPDADAIGELEVEWVNTVLGIFRVTLPASLTVSLPRAPELFWRAQVDLGGGDILVCKSTQGPLQLLPFLELVPAPEVEEELQPDDEQTDLEAMTAMKFVGVRDDITSAALHRAVVTAGHAPLPWVILTLEDGVLTPWTLRAKEDGEVDDGASYRTPDDYDASTNNVIWVRSALG